ncbi:MAG: tryptophan synthase subunit alpha [Candidatus Omnitrophica bacterium]|nr:tryptophan synthase subunit alpha [Candidatus Omnitrophota bacterium]
MNRIDSKFKELKTLGRTAFIPYITAGDPDLKATGKLVMALERSGADIIELGIPFSDPMADGPTIQRAIKRSLDNGCTAKKVLALVKTLRKKVDVPIVFMTYFNIVFNYGVERFVRDAKFCGADGLIIPDLPLEESAGISKCADKYEFRVILLAAPTTPPDRFRRIAAGTGGFIYYVSLTGVTGARKVVPSTLKRDLDRLRKMTKIPLCAGFGISGKEQASEIAPHADGVIIGSAIINIIENNLSDQGRMFRRTERFSAGLAKAVHGA